MSTASCRTSRVRAALCAFLLLFGGASAASAAGDLLVAPTRIVLDGPRGTEVILNNIGAEPATYRISLELRRMKPDGSLEDIAPEGANPVETAALEMISYAPRRITLPPHQPQAIRIGVRAPEGLPDGEYRAHMLFRAIPDATPATEQSATSGSLSIAITPIYGVTIPIIVRRGALSATAAISDVRLTATEGGAALAFTLARTGTRSVYGEVRVLKPGVDKPIIAARGIAVYPELAQRTVTLPLPQGAELRGPATIQYFEDAESGGRLITEARVELR